MMGTAQSPAAREAMKAGHAQEDSKLIGPPGVPTEPCVVFYQLERKFVDDERSVSQQSRDVLYYTLAVGHHSGVIDCFAERMSCPLALYERIMECFNEGSSARYKLEGVLRSGEIQIDQSHVVDLAGAVRGARLEALHKNLGERAVVFLSDLSEALDVMGRSPAVYLMGRRRMP